MMAVQAHGSYTLCLQVMDKGVDKPFKEYLHQESMTWLVAQPQNTTPLCVVIAQWIHMVWEKVTDQAIINTWAVLE